MNNRGNMPINLIVVNTSNLPLCVEGRYYADYFYRGSSEIQIETKKFYDIDGVLEFTLGDGKKFYALVEKNVYDLSIHIDKSGHLHTEPGSFKQGSFKFSDKDDFIKYVLLQK